MVRGNQQNVPRRVDVSKDEGVGRPFILLHALAQSTTALLVQLLQRNMPVVTLSLMVVNDYEVLFLRH